VPADPLGPDRGLSLRPFRALRPAVDGAELADRLCPPYDVIDAEHRAQLVAAHPLNAVAVVLPEADDGGDAYQHAAQLLEQWVAEGACAVDEAPALYVYEMRDVDGTATRGLVGAVELRDPADRVILPHENTMAGPVADRLALMSATQANVEPIYLVYDGAGRASELVAAADQAQPLARTSTPDGIRHTLWAITDPAALDEIAADLAERRALIADGHHRYATYRELQQRLRAEHGAGPWDYGLTLLVDSTSYGPQVHAIHRVLPGLALTTVLERTTSWGLRVEDVADAEAGLAAAADHDGFAVILTDGKRSAMVTDPERRVSQSIRTADEPAALADLDVTILHRGLVERVWRLADTVDNVGYAHSVAEAVAAARESGGTAVLLRPTPVAAVAAVAAAGARMPRKSTLFTPKPASGLLMRRFVDE
jgi:uncharacterized protein (DUF1015 family)